MLFIARKSKSMARKNILTTHPPYAVEKALKRLGMNLRTARLRRNLTLEEVAVKIGAGRRGLPRIFRTTIDLRRCLPVTRVCHEKEKIQ